MNREDSNLRVTQGFEAFSPTLNEPLYLTVTASYETARNTEMDTVLEFNLTISGILRLRQWWSRDTSVTTHSFPKQKKMPLSSHDPNSVIFHQTEPVPGQFAEQTSLEIL